jgi:hypothetical protein
MSTLLVAAIIIACTVIPPVLFVRFTKRKAEKIIMPNLNIPL